MRMEGRGRERKNVGGRQAGLNRRLHALRLTQDLAQDARGAGNEETIYICERSGSVSWPICESCGSMSADGATCGSSSAAASERGVGEALESNSSDRKRTRHERDASVQYSTIQILLKHYIVRAVMCVVSCPMVPVGLVLRSTLCGPLTHEMDPSCYPYRMHLDSRSHLT
jgi:hypothetical protein